MLVIPCQLNATEYTVFIALQDENLERMKLYDPAEVNIAKIGGLWSSLKLRDVIIGYATADDEKKVIELCSTGEIRGALQFLSRGFRFRPDAGDHDAPYLSNLVRKGERKQ